MIAIHTRRRVKFAATVFAVVGIALLAMAVLFPSEGATLGGSIRYWALAAVVGVIGWFAIEGVGTWLLSREALERLPSWARIVAIFGSVVLLTVAGYIAVVYLSGNLL